MNRGNALWAWGAALALAVWLCFAPSTRGEAPHAIILVTAEKGPYKIAADACEERLSRAGISVIRTDLASYEDAPSGEGAISIVAIGGPAAKRAASFSGSIDGLFYCLTPDPDRLGLTDRNDTSGISASVSLEDQLALIRRTLPRAKKIGFLYRSSSQGSSEGLGAYRESLPKGLELVAVDLDAHGSDAEAIDALLHKGVDIIWTTPEPTVYNAAIVKALLTEALKHRVPVFGFSGSMVRAGSLVGVGVNPQSQGVRCAELYLKGEPGVHLYADAVIAVNTTVSQSIDTPIPGEVMSDADEVFGRSGAGRRGK